MAKKDVFCRSTLPRLCWLAVALACPLFCHECPLRILLSLSLDEKLLCEELPDDRVLDKELSVEDMPAKVEEAVEDLKIHGLALYFSSGNIQG